ncbi:hypothetical protein BpHYR1_001727 [Brachionus plicatilis]|uniref:Uncharacterized protein n=1 Tax=Brachionus plicatilis TaxID=10195 RepID=A0A3M7SYR5_BRAPC|nr:hypothetical protein BpHYR1_001727 [Brachionus plicatilis]
MRCFEFNLKRNGIQVQNCKEIYTKLQENYDKWQIYCIRQPKSIIVLQIESADRLLFQANLVSLQKLNKSILMIF